MNTQTIDLARDNVALADIIGLRAVFTTYEGARLVGVVERSRGGLDIVLPNGQRGHVGVASTIEIEA